MNHFKTIFLLFSVFIFTGFSFSQAITVVDPHSGDNWCKSRAYEIKWTQSGSMDSNVKIRLFDSTSTVNILGIVDNTDNDGSYLWTIPDTLPAGNYRIRVKTVDNAVSDDSDTFAISECAASSITIDSPRAGSEWYKTRTYSILWTRSGSLHNRVKIRLYDTSSTTKILDIANDTENSGKYDWKIPESLNSDNYRIRVKTLDNLVSDDSEIFKISTIPLPPPDFELTGLITPPGYGGNLHRIDVKLKNNAADYEGPLTFRIIGLDKLAGGKFTLDQKRTYTLKIARGETLTKGILGRVDWPAGVCSVNFAAIVDPDNKIKETNERNNTLERKRYFGELSGKKYCKIRLDPKMIKIGKASLRPVPYDGSIILAHDRADIMLTLVNYCSESITLEYSIIFDYTTFLRDGANKEIWKSRITLRPCEVKPFRISSLKIPKKKEFKVLAIREHYYHGARLHGYGIIYKFKVRVDY